MRPDSWQGYLGVVLLFLVPLIIAWVFLARSWSGELPVEVVVGSSGVKWSDVLRDTVDALLRQADVQQVELDALRSRVDHLALVERQVTVLDARIDALARRVATIEEELEELTDFVTQA